MGLVLNLLMKPFPINRLTKIEKYNSPVYSITLKSNFETLSDNNL